MFGKIKKIKENKTLKMIGNILYIFFFVIVVLMLLVVMMQRVTNNNIAVGGFRMFSVATGSMIPVYEVGDILVSKEIEPEDIRVGDDLVYKGVAGTFRGKVVTHRVISIEKQEDGNYKIITKGVANELEDPEINQTQVYGKVICNLKLLGVLQRAMQNVYMIYSVVFIALILLTIGKIRSTIRERNEDICKEENDGEVSKNTEKDKD